MKITLRLFAVLREQAGISQLALELSASATVADARDVLLALHPSLSSFVPRVVYAVNRNYAPISTPLHDGDEVALIPPVSGG